MSPAVITLMGPELPTEHSFISLRLQLSHDEYVSSSGFDGFIVCSRSIGRPDLHINVYIPFWDKLLYFLFPAPLLVVMMYFYN